jgi:hypothetical protein
MIIVSLWLQKVEIARDREVGMMLTKFHETTEHTFGGGG